MSFLFLSCNKGMENPVPQPEREPTIPEKVEKELTGILAEDWQSLADTLAYFNSTMLSKGKFKGFAPDSVYYELDIRLNRQLVLETTFKIEDSTFVTVCGRLIPLKADLYAFNMLIGIDRDRTDSLTLSASKVKVIVPNFFLLSKNSSASLIYEDKRVGFVRREEFENIDYSTGTYLVVHYFDDPRTFALYDNGLANLLKMSLADAGK